MGENKGRPWNARKSRWQHWRERQAFKEQRARPEPVKVLVRNFRTVDRSGLPARPGKPPSILPEDRLVTLEEMAAAYDQATAGTPGTVETTLEELLGKNR